jgi:hypothetical protein
MTSESLRSATPDSHEVLMRLDVRMVRDVLSLHRLVGLLWRRAAEIVALDYSREMCRDRVAVTVLARSERVGHIVECVRREVLVVSVDADIAPTLAQEDDTEFRAID